LASNWRYWVWDYGFWGSDMSLFAWEVGAVGSNAIVKDYPVKGLASVLQFNVFTQEFEVLDSAAYGPGDRFPYGSNVVPD